MNRITGTYPLLRHPTKIIWQIALLALLTGGFIYIFLRPTPPLFFGLLHQLGLSDLLDAVRLTTLVITPMVPGWVVYSLPQGLWTFAYTLTMADIWGRQRDAIAIFWLATIPLLTLGFEGMQYIRLIRGTFCPQDMLISLGAIFAGTALIFFAKEVFTMANQIRAPRN